MTLAFTSPFTGAVLTNGEFASSASFTPDVRDFCSQALGRPPLAITFLDGGRVVAFDAPVSSLANATGRVDVVMHHPIAAAWNSKMLRAIKADDARVVQKCLCDGQDPNTAFPNGFTALSYSASNSATACVTLLLTTKASPNIRGLNGNTALHQAVYTEDTQAVQLLLQHGAEADALDARGTTSANWASEDWGFAGPTILTCLVESNADLHLQDRDMDTPFALATGSASSSLSVIMSAVWDRLRWLDVLVRHECYLAGFVNTNHLQLACRTTGMKFEWNLARYIAPRNTLGGADALAQTDTMSLSHAPAIRGISMGTADFCCTSGPDLECPPTLELGASQPAQ